MPVVELEFDSDGALKGAKEYGTAADNVVKKTDAVVTSSGKGKSAFSQWGTEARQLANTLGTVLVAGIGVASAAVTGFIAKSVSMASDMEETQAMFDQVFKGMEDQAEAWAQTLNESYLMSERAAKDYLGSLTAMLKPMGLAQQQAGEMSNTLVQLAADMGSAWNVETEKVIQDMRSALAGSNETLQKYGIVVKESTLQQKAMEMGLADTAKEVGAAERAQALYALMLEKTKDQQGDVARNTDTYAAQMRELTKNIEDITTQIGQIFLPVVTEMLKGINDWISSQENLNMVIQGSIDVMRFLYNGYQGILAGLKALIAGFATGASKVVNVLHAIEQKQVELGRITENGFDGMKAALDDFAASAQENFLKTWENIETGNQYFDNLKAKIDETGDAVGVLKEEFSGMADKVKNEIEQKAIPAVNKWGETNLLAAEAVQLHAETTSIMVNGIEMTWDVTKRADDMMMRFSGTVKETSEKQQENNEKQKEAAVAAQENAAAQREVAAAYADVGAQASGAAAAIEEASRQSSHGGGDTSVTTSASGSTTYPEWFTDEMRAAYDRAYSDYLTNQDYIWNNRQIGYSPLKTGYYDAGPDLSPGDPAEWAAKMGYDPNDTGDYSSGGGGGVTVNVTQPLTETELANLISDLERAEARA